MNTCAHCGSVCARKTGRFIFPKIEEAWHKQYWYCARCDAHVAYGDKGRAANAELRNARSMLWKRIHEMSLTPSGKRRRRGKTKIYNSIRDKLDFTAAPNWICTFDLDQCRAVWRALNEVDKEKQQQAA